MKKQVGTIVRNWWCIQKNGTYPVQLLIRSKRVNTVSGLTGLLLSY